MGDPAPKRLDEMDDLRDMGRFPVPVYVGATANILMTIWLTYRLRGRFDGPLALPAWAVGIVCANLLPVVALRSRMDEGTSFPPSRRWASSATSTSSPPGSTPLPRGT